LYRTLTASTFELYKIVGHPNGFHFTLLGINVVVVLYLAWVRWDEVLGARAKSQGRGVSYRTRLAPPFLSQWGRLINQLRCVKDQCQSSTRLERQRKCWESAMPR